MAGGNHTFCNLIQFVSQQSKRGDEKVAKKTSNSEFDEDGIEIKNFYERLINDDTATNKNDVSLDPADKLDKKQMKDQYNSVMTKTKCLCEADFDKKTKFREVCTKSSDLVAEFNQPTALSSFHIQNQHSKLLQAAQMGNLQDVVKLLDSGADVNVQDFYGWTPLMCAAKEGHEKVVKYLLIHCCDHTLRSLENQTASMLAKMSGHKHIVKAISDFLLCHKTCDIERKSDISDSFLRETHITSDDAARVANNSGTYFCQICKSEFSLSEKKSHETSTVHLLSSGHKKPKGASYLIPETNKGFQMLLKRGWEVDKGLGPTGEGPKYPVKTVLKYDRKGLGSDVCVKKKAKITHFNPNDKSAIAHNSEKPQRIMTARKAARYAAKSKERKDRQRERHLRLEFNSGFE